MPKALLIDPAEMRSRRVLDFKPIPINQYDRSLGDELAAGSVHQGRSHAHPARHDDHPRI